MDRAKPDYQEVFSRVLQSADWEERATGKTPRYTTSPAKRWGAAVGSQHNILCR